MENILLKPEANLEKTNVGRERIKQEFADFYSENLHQHFQNTIEALAINES